MRPPDNETTAGASGKGGAEAPRFGMFALTAAGASMLVCYAGIMAESFFGEAPVAINPHLQAVAMWGLGLVAVVAIALDSRRHGQLYPVLTGLAGVGVLIGTLYLAYDQRFEALAYVLLLVAAVLNQRAMISGLYDDVRRQSEEIAKFNESLSSEVERQIGEIDRLTRLKEFLPPAVAEIVVSDGSDRRLESHRRYIACMVVDIRGFVAFSDGTEPEDTIDLIRTFHEHVGRLALAHDGTIAHRAGDGIMVIFNDPVPCDRPVLDAVRLALEIRETWGGASRSWSRLGHAVGLGIGIACGYATLGLVGDRARMDYTAIGNPVNLAARLCAEAKEGEILMGRRAALEVEDTVDVVRCKPLAVKGLAQPVECVGVLGLVEDADLLEPEPGTLGNDDGG